MAAVDHMPLDAYLSSLPLDLTTRYRGSGYTDYTLQGFRPLVARLIKELNKTGFVYTVVHGALHTSVTVHYVWTKPENWK